MGKLKIFIAIIIVLLSCNSITNEIISGDYFNDTLPENNPKMFAENIISTGYHLHSSAIFSSDLQEVYFVIGGSPFKTIVTMKQKNGEWSKPDIPSFSGKYTDDHPMLSPDNEQLFFDSRRPKQQTGKPISKSDIWVVNRANTGWSNAQRLPEKINTDEYHELHPTVAENRNLYFASDRPGGKGSTDIYVSKFINGKYTTPVNLGDSINTTGLEAWLYIHPKEEYILFSGFNRNDETNGGIYVSYNLGNNVWSKSELLIELTTENTTVRMPCLSPDGKYLFFNVQGGGFSDYSSKKLSYEEYINIKTGFLNNHGNVYWIKADFLNN